MATRKTKKKAEQKQPSPIEAAKTIIAAATLVDVRVLKVSASAPRVERPVGDTGEEGVGQEYTLSTRAEHRCSEGSRHEFMVGVQIVLPPDSTAEDASLFIQVERMLTYDGVPEDAKDSELEAFALTNAVYNAWPYLRADVQEYTTKMGYAPLVLPLYRVR